MKIKIKLLIICFLVNLKLSAQYQIVPPDSIPSTILSISKSFAFDFYNFSKPKNFTKFLTEKGDLYFLKSYDIKIQTHYSNEIYKEYGNITKVVLH